MKLIDILVQELPKRGGWPDGAVCITQDADGSICTWGAAGVFFRGHWQHPSGKSLLKYWCREGFKVIEDYATTIITREQYEAALKQPVWNGTGLPPVGVECERSWCGDNWLKCKVLFVSDETVVVKLATREAAYGINEVKFRPIRSERDEAIEQMRKVVTNYNKTDVIHAIEQLYDAGYRKQ